MTHKISLFCLLILLVGCGEGVDNSLPPDVESKAVVALRGESKVLDVLYDPDAAVEWHVSVLDDGTSQNGYANYVCQILNGVGATNPKTIVRIVDAKKVTERKSFREASLGSAMCKDYRPFDS